MKGLTGNLKKPIAAVQLFFMMVWATYLSGTDSLYSSYALLLLVASLCLYSNYTNGRSSSGLPLALNITLSSLLSFASTLANYPVFQYVRDDCSAITYMILNLIAAGATFLGRLLVFHQIFLLEIHHCP